MLSKSKMRSTNTQQAYRKAHHHLSSLQQGSLTPNKLTMESINTQQVHDVVSHHLASPSQGPLTHKSTMVFTNTHQVYSRGHCDYDGVQGSLTSLLSAAQTGAGFCRALASLLSSLIQRATHSSDLCCLHGDYLSIGLSQSHTNHI